MSTLWIFSGRRVPRWRGEWNIGLGSMLPSILTGLVFIGTSSPVFTWFSPWFSPSNSEVSCKCSLKYVYYISHENVPFNQSHEMRIFPFFLLLLQPLQPPRPLQATLGGLLRRRRGQRERAQRAWPVRRCPRRNLSHVARFGKICR